MNLENKKKKVIKGGRGEKDITIYQLTQEEMDKYITKFDKKDTDLDRSYYKFLNDKSLSKV